MKILIVTDAYFPQVNGVVRTLHETGEVLKSQGHTLEYITPQQFLTVPMPKYNEIRLSINIWPRVSNLINSIKPDAIHIATEGPLGFMARRHCIKKGLKFTTSFHTRFDKYIKLYMPIIPAKWSDKFLCNFHNKAERILIIRELLNKKNQTFKLSIGKKISSLQNERLNNRQIVDKLRSIVVNIN